ncbi:MAG: glycosyltransferase family 2 protein [Armatimonadota bacterium]
MDSAPMVSVVMPVYNTAQYLPEAVDSILGQTLNNFEFLIIDDGSTDGSGEILDRCQESDNRIRVFHQENAGLAVSLNVGLRAAKGKYIARMDSDDISFPQRLAKQTAFMDAHPEVGVCGTAFKQFGDSSGESWTMTDPEEIRSRLLFWPCLGHPTVMMRRELIVEKDLYYNADFKQAEDHELWLRFSAYCKLTNLPEVLLLYRTQEKQATNKFRADILVWAARIQISALKSLGIDPSDDEITIHQSLFTSSFEKSRVYVERVEQWLCKLLDANEKTHVYDRDAFARVLFERWCSVCSLLGPWIWVKFRTSKLFSAGRRAGCNCSVSFARCFFGRSISIALNASKQGRYIKKLVRRSA